MGDTKTLDVTITSAVLIAGKHMPRGKQLRGVEYSLARSMISANQAIEGLHDLDPEVSAEQQQQNDAERLELIVAAIGELGPDDFTQGGLPEVEALEGALGFDLSAAERDQAWKTHKARQAEAEGQEG